MEDRYSQLEKQLRAIQEAHGSVIEENQELYRKVSELEEQLSVSQMPLDLIKTIVIYANTPDNRRRVGRSELDFDVWQKGIVQYATEPLNKKIEVLDREIGSLRGVLFSSEMDKIMGSNPNFRNVGFVYYDFANGRSLYTPALLELFGISEADAKGKQLSLRSFINHLGRENRGELVAALREGRGIENYPVITRDGSRNLILNAFPIVYDHNPVGVGVFLYNPAADFNKKYAYAFASKIRRAMKNISQEFEVIGRDSQHGKTEKPLDSQLLDADVIQIVDDESIDQTQ